MGKLKSDSINFTLTLNADKAQEAIYELRKSSKDLTEQNKELKKRMVDLVAAGQKNSKQYRRLEEDLKANNSCDLLSFLYLCTIANNK